ncbi:uncharacterized protein N7477_000135 [Penicillium maclennaniae]|uniref:uncharacterized protein n=1 Tax=Penicillium maclennaniae TaxID=1343394 RepID=UPI0025409C91|nr:uncharacterized protein N7477_000135 [Penicillium maclennaniae]KAJ5683790.1 hypothetical protein N7477_000135 [Penicillium maclennaniae]
MRLTDGKDDHTSSDEKATFAGVVAEGLDDSYIRYHLRGQIIGDKDDITDIWKPLKVYRICTTLLIPEPTSIQNIWTGRIMYSVGIPNYTIELGNVLPIQFQFTPLMKELHLALIKISLVETHTNKKDTIQTACSKRSRTVLKDQFTPPAWREMEISSDDAN